MAVPFYSSPRARFFNSNGQPLAEGRVSFYFNGTSTLKQVYTDSSEATPAQNPQLLDIEGYVREGGVWLGQGLYDIVLESSDGAGGYLTEWTMEGVPGQSVVPTGSVGDVAFVTDIGSLIDLPAGQYGAAYVFGYFSPNDGGQGWFIWEGSSSAASDGGAIIAPAGAPALGRWKRVFSTSEASVAHWGATPTAPGSVNFALESAMDYVNASGSLKTLIVPTGELTINANVTFVGDYRLELQQGAKFVGSGNVTIQCADAEMLGRFGLVGPNVNLAWFPRSGADVDMYAWYDRNPTDQVASFGSANAIGRILMTGFYTINSVALAQPQIVERAHFMPGCQLVVDSPVAFITFRDATFEAGVEGCVTGTARESLQFDCELPVKAVSNALTLNSAYEKALQCATGNGTWRGRLLWDTRDSVTITYSDLTYDFESRVTEPVRVAGEFNMGRIVNSGREQVFHTSSTQTPILANGTIYATWWGVGHAQNATTWANNKESIIKSLRCQRVSKVAGMPLAWVSGNGETFIIDSRVERYGVNDVRLKEISVFIEDGVTGAAAGPALYWQDCTSIELVNVKSQAISIFDNTGHTKAIGCECVNYATPGAPGFTTYLSIGKTSGSVENVTILGCTFDTQFAVLCNSNTGSVFSGIVIEGNTFSRDASSPPIVIHSNPAGVGHGPCSVKDNLILGAVSPLSFDRGTEYSGSILHPTSVSSSREILLSAVFLETFALFRRSALPIGGSISCQGEVAGIQTLIDSPLGFITNTADGEIYATYTADSSVANFPRTDTYKIIFNELTYPV